MGIGAGCEGQSWTRRSEPDTEMNTEMWWKLGRGGKDLLRNIQTQVNVTGTMTGTFPFWENSLQCPGPEGLLEEGIFWASCTGWLFKSWGCFLLFRHGRFFSPQEIMQISFWHLAFTSASVLRLFQWSLKIQEDHTWCREMGWQALEVFRHQCRDQIFPSKLVTGVDRREGIVIFGIYQRNFGKLILRLLLSPRD